MRVRSGFSESAGTVTVLVLASGAFTGKNLREMLRTAGYKADVVSKDWDRCVLTGVQLAVLFSSEPYWRIEQICEICSAIRRNAPDLPVIAVGPNDVETKVRLFELGADDYLVESFDQAELLARIRALIRRNRPRR